MSPTQDADNGDADTSPTDNNTSTTTSKETNFDTGGSNPNSFEKDDSVPNVSHSGDQEDLSPGERRQRANEIYSRLSEGRGKSSTVTLQTPYEPPYDEIACDINLSKLDLETRWDALSALPDGMFQAANDVEDPDDIDESDITISANVVPDGEGVGMLRLIVRSCLEPRGFSDGDWNQMVKNDLADNVLIQVGMGLLEMSFDRGEITGFRFE